MNILYFFQEIGTPMFQWQRVHIINELEQHGCQVTTFNPLHYATPVEANDAVLMQMRNCRYDLFFTNVGYYKVLFPETVEQIKKMGIPTLCLRCDNLVIPFNDKVLAPHFDLVWLTAIETKYLYDHWGVKSFFAPYAANPFVFQSGSDGQNIRKVCFIGTPYGSRSIMINSLSRGCISVDAYYKKTESVVAQQPSDSAIKSNLIWPSRVSVVLHRLQFPAGRKMMLGMIVNKLKGQVRIEENKNLSSLPVVLPDEQGAIYSRYALCLASTSTNHTDVLKNPLKIVNLRNFEIPMSGGIEICKYNPELADYFEDGKEIIFYQDNDELVDKARYYIQKATDYELNAIKLAARKRAEAEHTWWNRFTKAFDILGIHYEL